MKNLICKLIHRLMILINKYLLKGKIWEIGKEPRIIITSDVHLGKNTKPNLSWGKEPKTYYIRSGTYKKDDKYWSRKEPKI